LGAAALLAAFACFPAGASAGRREERVATASLPAPVRVLVMTPPSYEASLTRRFPVLYFLHDGRGSEDVFFREGLADALEKDMREGSLPEMLVVAPRGHLVRRLAGRRLALRDVPHPNARAVRGRAVPHGRLAQLSSRCRHFDGRLWRPALGA